MPATVWKGFLSFGLVSIPVRLYRAARAERVRFHQVYRPERDEEEPAAARERKESARETAARALRGRPAPAETHEPPEPPVERVRQQVVSESGDQAIPRGELLKGYEYDRDRYVVVGNEEIERITPKTSTAMQILEFVKFAEIDPIHLESSYYMAPDKGGERAYAMLFEAMRRTGYAALAQVAMHRREHIIAVRPGRTGVIAHTLYYLDEIRQELEYHTDTGAVTDREIELAVTFIQSLAGPFQPEKFRDTFRERLESMIAAKVQGRQVAEALPPQPAKGQVIDIVEALQKSLAIQRKPPGGAAHSEAGTKGVKRTPRGRRGA